MIDDSGDDYENEENKKMKMTNEEDKERMIYSTSTTFSVIDNDCDEKIKIDDYNEENYKDKFTSKGFPWSQWNPGGWYS